MTGNFAQRGHILAPSATSAISVTFPVPPNYDSSSTVTVRISFFLCSVSGTLQDVVFELNHLGFIPGTSDFEPATPTTTTTTAVSISAAATISDIYSTSDIFALVRDGGGTPLINDFYYMAYNRDAGGTDTFTGVVALMAALMTQ